MPKPRTATPHPLAGALAAVLLLTAAGCSTTTVAPVGTQLSGHWVLDRDASDDANAKIESAIALAQTKLRERRARYGLDSGGPGGGAGGGHRGGGGGPGGASGGGDTGGDENFDGPSDINGGPGQLGPDFKELRERLKQALQAPQTLKIEVSADEVQITPDNIPARDYRTGEQFSRFDEYGTSKIVSSWSGGAFVLHARYSNASRNERYEIMPHSQSLTLTRALQDPIVGKIETHSLYHRQ